MDYSLPLPQTIGTNFGYKNDGVLLGTVSHLDFNGLAYFTYAHEITWAIQNNFNVPTSQYIWTPYQDDFNAAVAAAPFTPLNIANPLPELYLAVREDITSFKFNVTTAGIGTFVIEAQYNSPTGYIPIPGATFSSNFLKQTGISTLEFTPPTDWVTSTIGYPTDPERWLRLVISSGTISTQPVITGAWEVSTDISEAGAGEENPPFYNPYKNLLPQTGDTLYMSSTYQPYGFTLSYIDGLSDGTVSYVYSKADGTFSPLTVISDTSNGLTEVNPQTWDQLTLTSTGTSAVAYTDQGIDGDGYVEATVTGVVTNLANRLIIALTEDQSTFGYAIQANPATSDNYIVTVNGVDVFTSAVPIAQNDVLQVWRKDKRLYFFVNGENIDPDGTLLPYEFEGIMYGRLGCQDNGTVVPVTLTNWSKRAAFPLELTVTTPTNFSDSTSSETANFPATYFIQFAPPSDFASLSALLSKTGVAGFNIGIVSDFTSGTPTANVNLMLEKALTVNSTDNVFLNTGEQTILQRTNLVMYDNNIDFAENTFLFIIKTALGVTTRTVTMGPSDLTQTILTQAVAKTGMTGIIIVQVDGDEEIVIGSPSYFTINT